MGCSMRVILAHAALRQRSGYSAEPDRQIKVVLNWTRELLERVPAAGGGPGRPAFSDLELVCVHG